ncbi:hypothetical protein D3C76_980130 [compost metagenome]
MADIDDLAGSITTDQKARHCLDGFLRGRQADAHQRFGAQCLQTLEAQRQVAAALAGGDGVDFINDHRAGGAEHLPPGVGAEQHVKRFRGGDQDVRRGLAHRRAVFLRCIAGAHGGADAQLGQAHHPQLFADTGQRVLQVDLDVVGQRLERRNVDHQGFVRQAFEGFQATVDQVVDHGEEGGEGLAGTGGGGDQGRAALADQRPRPGLGGGDRRESLAEPGADGGVEAGQGTVCGDGQVHGLIYAGDSVKMQVPLRISVDWQGLFAGKPAPTRPAVLL